MTTLEKIGSILKDQRIQLGFSLEEMSVKTKLSTVQLKAIEDGNISFFKEDLSYLTYFVRYYANALNLDYDSLRIDLDDKINEYTDAISLSKIKEAENINTSIMEKIRIKQSTQVSKRRKKIDFTSMALIALVVVVVSVLGFIFFTRILPQIGKPNESPVINNPKPEVPELPVVEEPEVPAVPEKPTFSVSQENPTTYLVSGWTENTDTVFNVKFESRSWVRFSMDGVFLENPASTIYEKGVEITIVVKPQENSVLKMEFGYMAGNTISLDGVPVELDAGIASASGNKVLFFKFVGGN